VSQREQRTNRRNICPGSERSQRRKKAREYQQAEYASCAGRLALIHSSQGREKAEPSATDQQPGQAVETSYLIASATAGAFRVASGPVTWLNASQSCHKHRVRLRLWVTLSCYDTRHPNSGMKFPEAYFKAESREFCVEGAEAAFVLVPPRGLCPTHNNSLVLGHLTRQPISMQRLHAPSPQNILGYTITLLLKSAGNVTVNAVPTQR
jgi:hypothetical protein